MSRYLIVSWAGSGNLVPTSGICRALVDAGHDVRAVGHNMTGELFATAGARFRSFTQDAGWGAHPAPGVGVSEEQFLITNLC